VAGPVLGALLVAAILHASWNAIAKLVPDQRVAAGLLGAAGVLPGAVGAAVLPAPDRAAWPILAGSSIISAGYLLLLVHAYRYGEFGQVYPLARGLPPLLIALFSLAVLGERLTAGQFVGVVVVSLALTALVFADGRPRATAGLGLAVATGAVLAVSAVVDGVGVRVSGHPLSYAMWLFLLQGPLAVAACRVMFGAGYWRAMARSARLGTVGGLLAMVAYSTVLWAQSQAPLALVSALRETSLLFAGVIGALVFGERFSGTRLVATGAAVAGIVLVQVT
jgi:drug/metabolite transporter (DMT)-like permease